MALNSYFSGKIAEKELKLLDVSNFLKFILKEEHQEKA